MNCLIFFHLFLPCFVAKIDYEIFYNVPRQNIKINENKTTIPGGSCLNKASLFFALKIVCPIVVRNNRTITDLLVIKSIIKISLSLPQQTPLIRQKAATKKTRT